MQKDDFQAIRDNLVLFDSLDDEYYKIHDKSMGLIEKYSRENVNEIGIIK